jgi:hypothetical protein
LDEVVERLWVITPPGMVDFDGSYSEWAVKVKAEEKRAKAAGKK